jgi:hypothetical protein
MVLSNIKPVELHLWLQLYVPLTACMLEIALLSAARLNTAQNLKSIILVALVTIKNLLEFPIAVLHLHSSAT